MLARLHRYLLIALLLVIPVQGMAAVMHAFACGSQAAVAAGSDEHGAQKHDMTAAHHDHGAAHQHDQQPGKAGADSAQHQCCHQILAAPTVHVAPAPADLPVYESSPAVLDVTFVLEQPQRPPRA